ncbi:MAG: methyltransferase domain-containing protein [Candidatus Dojkabacteria bacterium]
MIKISDYDMFDYDYSTYWAKREYENMAEKILLNKLLDNEKGIWFLDIGGSYGRLTSTYYDKFSKPIILDYSLKTLQKNKDILLSKYNNIELIAANAYKLPFAENSIDAGLMVRVLHHIEKPAIYFKELARVMKNRSTYIQEYPNKVHIKAAIKAILRFDFNFFKKDAYIQPTQNNFEGVKKGVEGVFLNYHPKYISSIMEKYGFSIKEKYGCSFLRSQFLKKIINQDDMVSIENLLQETLSWSNISPSIFLKTEFKETKVIKETEFQTLEELLVCPECKQSLKFEDSQTATCKKCSTSYHKNEGIWDFRIK